MPQKERDVKLFEFAIIKHPTAKEAEEGKQSTLIIPPRAVLAPNDKAAAMLAGREIPAEELAHIDRLEVAVRPF